MAEAIQPECRFVIKQIRGQLKMLNRHIAQIDKKIKELIKKEPELARRYEILISIKGIGPVTAITLIADLEELGACSSKEIAALVGVAPMNWDSGLLLGKRITKGGRSHVRSNLYMAAMSARNTNPDMKTFYDRLVGDGKKAMVALVAVMKKLVILANTLIREDRLWVEKYA